MKRIVAALQMLIFRAVGLQIRPSRLFLQALIGITLQITITLFIE